MKNRGPNRRGNYKEGWKKKGTIVFFLAGNIISWGPTFKKGVRGGEKGEEKEGFTYS